MMLYSCIMMSSAQHKTVGAAHRTSLYLEPLVTVGPLYHCMHSVLYLWLVKHYFNMIIWKIRINVTAYEVKHAGHTVQRGTDK